MQGFCPPEDGVDGVPENMVWGARNAKSVMLIKRNITFSAAMWSAFEGRTLNLRMR